MHVEILYVPLFFPYSDTFFAVYFRVEAIGQIEYMLSGVNVIELEGTCLRLSLKTPIPTSDSLLLRHKLDCLREPNVLDHELLIEVVDKTLELKSVEVF